MTNNTKTEYFAWKLFLATYITFSYALISCTISKKKRVHGFAFNYNRHSHRKIVSKYLLQCGHLCSHQEVQSTTFVDYPNIPKLDPLDALVIPGS